MVVHFVYIKYQGVDWHGIYIYISNMYIRKTIRWKKNIIIHGVYAIILVNSFALSSPNMFVHDLTLLMVML